MPTASRKPTPRTQPDIPESQHHGFYSHGFHQVESEELHCLIAGGVQDEIAMLRVFIRRVFTLGDGIEDMDEAVRLLDTLGLSATRLANLVKTQKLLNNDQSEIAQDISQAIAEVIKEMGLKK